MSLIMFSKLLKSLILANALEFFDFRSIHLIHTKLL